MGINFNGFLSNNDDLPKKKKKSAANKASSLKNMYDPEILKEMLPEDLMNRIEEAASMMGKSADDIINQAAELSQKMINGLSEDELSEMFSGLEEGQMPLKISMSLDQWNEAEKFLNTDDNTIRITDGDLFKWFETSNIKYLESPSDFSAVLVKEDENLYTNFVNKFGNSDWTIDDLFAKSEGGEMTITSLGDSEISIDCVNTLNLVCSNNKYILFLADSEDDSEQGIFVAVVQNPDTDEFELVIPKYFNTFNAMNNNLFSIDKDPMFFLNNRFMFTDVERVKIGLELALTPAKRTIMTINKFGTVSTVRTSNSKESRLLKIGTITSNESTESILLKKDGDLNLNETEFDLYIKLDDEYDAETLNHLSKFLSKVDFKNTKIAENVELKASPSGQCLYITLDLSAYCDNIRRIMHIDEMMNSKATGAVSPYTVSESKTQDNNDDEDPFATIKNENDETDSDSPSEITSSDSDDIDF